VVWSVICLAVVVAVNRANVLTVLASLVGWKVTMLFLERGHRQDQPRR
jgi:hypothetical protein